MMDRQHWPGSMPHDWKMWYAATSGKLFCNLAVGLSITHNSAVVLSNAD